MIEYNNGILRVNFTRSVWDVLWSCSFFLFMLSCICYGNFDDTNNYLYYFVFFLFLGVSMLGFFTKDLALGRIRIPLNSIWYGIFTLLCIVSFIWADSFSAASVTISKVVQILVITFCLTVYIDCNERLERYLNVVMAASMYLVVYILVNTPFEDWFSGFLGYIATGYNTNDIGCAMTICVIVSFYKAFVRHKKAAFVICAISFFVVILTSSRKSLFMSGAGIVMIVMFNYRVKNYLLRVLSCIGLVIIVIILIYEVPQLYNTVGVRLDSMVEYFRTDKSADSSIALRQLYIDFAKSMFREKPLLGYGINNFSYLCGLAGNTATYAHNNYMEIAADLGVVGLVTYYWFYAYLFFKLWRQTLDGHKTALLYLPMIILLIIFEYSMVNYYKMQVHLILASALSAISINEFDDSHSANSL